FAEGRRELVKIGKSKRSRTRVRPLFDPRPAVRADRRDPPLEVAFAPRAVGGADHVLFREFTGWKRCIEMTGDVHLAGGRVDDVFLQVVTHGQVLTEVEHGAGVVVERQREGQRAQWVGRAADRRLGAEDLRPVDIDQRFARFEAAANRNRVFGRAAVGHFTRGGFAESRHFGFRVAVILQCKDGVFFAFVAHRVRQRGVANRAVGGVDFFDLFAAAGAARLDQRAEVCPSTGFRPGRVRGAGFTVGDRLQFRPGFADTGQSATVEPLEVVLELVAGVGAVFADDPGDRRVAGAFRGFERRPDLLVAPEEELEVLVGQRSDRAAGRWVDDGDDRGLGDRERQQVGAAGDAGDVGDLFGGRRVIAADPREGGVERTAFAVVVPFFEAAGAAGRVVGNFRMGAFVADRAFKLRAPDNLLRDFLQRGALPRDAGTGAGWRRDGAAGAKPHIAEGGDGGRG